MRRVMASEAAGWCEGKLYGPDTELCREWKSDSRNISEGDAFVAIKGARTDGHSYIKQVVLGGAKLLLAASSAIESLFAEIPELKGISVIAVPDTSVAMSRIAQMYLQSVSPRVIAITGSVGKTTTRELSVSVLKSSYKVHSAIKSYNTVIGCSLTILSMPYDTEVLVLELGTNHFGEIAEMVSLFPPETAVITEVAAAHLAGFGSVEGVLKAKLEICRSAKLKNIVYNGDNHLLKAAMPAYDGVKKFSVGHDADDFLKIEDASISLKEDGASIIASYSLKNERKSYKIPFFGLQQAYNAGYAVILGNILGVAEDKIASSLENARPVLGRGVCRKISDGSWIIDESYNANPSSMGAAIANVLNINKDGKYRLVAFLGGMKELGCDSYLWHQKIIDKVKAFDTVVFIGEEWYDSKLAVPENIVRCAACSDAVHAVLETDLKNAVVLIKGSNSYGLAGLVSMLAGDMNDR